MFIKSISLTNFRNYDSENIEFSNGINILTGANAQGKTNVAEAIFYLCTGYSPRALKDKQVIKYGCDSAFISGTAQSLYGDVKVELSFDKSDRKQVFVNGIKVNKIGELMGNINSVFFNPSQLKLVQESPEDRRRFLNISLSQMYKSYFYALARYNKILIQRNNLLKNPDLDLVYQTLSVWDDSLSKEASKIIFLRNEFLSKISPIAEQKHAYLSDGKETLLLKSESGYSGSEEEIFSKVKCDLKSNINKDIRLGFTSIGPHRDDIKFFLNGVDAKIFGSQGQQRTIALSLKLAETELFFSRFNEYPILILDDVLSELDKKRQRKLLSAVNGIQTIFTSTDLDRTVFKSYPLNRIKIVNGKVKR